MRHHWKHVSRSFARTETQKKVASVLRGHNWKSAYYCTILPSRIADMLGIPDSWVLPTNSCTAALTAAYRFFTDEYVGPIMTYAASSAPARLLGLPVREVDVDDDGWPLQWDDITTAVELWGRPLPREPGGNLRVIDAAHRFAAPEHPEYLDRNITICYSFGPMKEIAAPCGGALVSKHLADPKVRQEVEAFLHYGQHGRVATGQAGFNGYMNEVTAAQVFGQLKFHKKNKEIRTRILQTYDNFLGKLLLTPPGVASGHVAVVRLYDRGAANRVKFRFSRAAWEYGIHYPLDEERYGGTNAFQLSKRIMTLPCHTLMQPVSAARLARIVLTA